ncbi:MAG: hypothetical protein KIS79_16610 [Burkholderiales bacterium]|nr:hypothetical protein [Burkholderiales bacterium]
MKITEAIVLAGSLLASLVFAADIVAGLAEVPQPGPLAVRDYSCTIVQDQIVCERNRTLIAIR